MSVKKTFALFVALLISCLGISYYLFHTFRRQSDGQFLCIFAILYLSIALLMFLFMMYRAHTSPDYALLSTFSIEVNPELSFPEKYKDYVINRLRKLGHTGEVVFKADEGVWNSTFSCFKTYKGDVFFYCNISNVDEIDNDAICKLIDMTILKDLKFEVFSKRLMFNLFFSSTVGLIPHVVLSFFGFIGIVNFAYSKKSLWNLLSLIIFGYLVVWIFNKLNYWIGTICHYLSILYFEFNMNSFRNEYCIIYGEHNRSLFKPMRSEFLKLSFIPFRSNERFKKIQKQLVEIDTAVFCAESFI